MLDETRKKPKADSRRKGAKFECAVAADLLLLTGVTFKRNLSQYQQAGDCDLTPDDAAFPFSLELKRYAAGNGCRPAWRDQSIRAANLIDRIPCVIFKYDRLPIVASVPIEAVNPAMTGTGHWVDLSLEALAMLAGEIMATNSGLDRGESPRDRSSRRIQSATTLRQTGEVTSQGAKL